MSWTMTHLAVAKAVNDKIGIAHDTTQYYMGAIAPDSVHFRANYTGEMKKNSHYLAYNKPWGKVDCIKECDDWLRDVLAKTEPAKFQKYSDFYKGVLVHILTDICNTKTFYVPFTQWYKSENRPQEQFRDAYYGDCKQIDTELYKNSPWTQEIWSLLLKAKCESIDNIINATEAEEHRTSQYNYYNNEKYEPGKPQRFISIEDNYKLIKDATDEIVHLLK
ncbi:MAG: hypothetical protein FWB80_02640 [Defluviitaleaceae bacterium]|nr:hypothetical protein [Defluviitaleaceae bacterium]